MVSQKGGKVTNGGVVGNAYSTMQKIALQKSELIEFTKKNYVQYHNFSN